MISSSSKMAYYIMMDYCMHLMALLDTKHDDSTTFHFGFNKIMELIVWNYLWLQLWKYVKKFIGSCDVYAWAKKTSSSLSWTLSTIVNPYIAIILNLYVLH
jgi:hypothetical protein